MDQRKLSAGILSLTLLTGVGAWALAQPVGQPPAKAAEKPGEEADGEKIEFAKAPEAVRAAALRAVGAGGAESIKKVIKEEDNGITTYEIEFIDAGVSGTATFSPAGEVLETERGITQEKLPAAALAALKKAQPNAALGSMVLVTKTYYEVEVVVNGKMHEVKVNAVGAIEGEPGAAQAGAGAEAAGGEGGEGFRKDFGVEKANLGVTGSNPYFTLTPGLIGVYHEGKTVLTVTALDETRVIDGVTTRVVEENEVKDGKTEEVSRNYFAIDKGTGDIYYFGEDVDEFDGAGKVSHPGVWHSGVNGARFGLFMAAKPRVGDKFYQEVAPGVAMDRVEVVSVEETVETAAGTFKNCVHLRETTPLETVVSHKWFAPGVGLVKDGEAALFSRPSKAGKP
ncbi:hypothetical protein BH11PLA1_BH11PLA1_03750 [soil metagenome]